MSDMGFQFTCDNCGKEVTQGPLPELRIVIETRGSGKHQYSESLSLQCCYKCARSIDNERRKIAEKEEKANAKLKKTAVKTVEPELTIEDMQKQMLALQRMIDTKMGVGRKLSAREKAIVKKAATSKNKPRPRVRASR